jgi:tetratricopeptide (TPR) repeat protein
MKRCIVAAGLLAALALLGTEVHAQSGAVRGKIVDEKGEALQDVKVTVDFQGGLTRKYEAKTNKKGEYTQVGLPPGDYKVTATKEGYQGAFITLHVGLGEPTQVPELKLLSAAAAQAAAQKAGGGPTAAQISADFKAAYELTQQGKLDEAEAAYKALLAKHPAIPEVHYNLGFIAGKRKDLPAAVAAYQKAIEMKADYGDAIVALAETHQAMGDADKAAEVLGKAAEQFPDDVAILFGTGIFYFNANRPSEAIAAFKKVEQLDSSNTEVHYYLGTLSVGQNDIPGALAHFETYLASAPTNPQYKATAEGLVAALKPKK